ncbi:hypothetical protein GQ53DRAFT_744113 [Thozetella sp. PMI_491]|nr:hypothetical protein GQ53DRAFT_744113 [Thozetella sp. PMI_491]
MMMTAADDGRVGEALLTPPSSNECDTPTEDVTEGVEQNDGSPAESLIPLRPASPSSKVAAKVVIPRFRHEWEAKKDAIYDLYITQSWALKDVIREMERAHHFKATARMYKRQLARWDIFKARSRGAPTRLTRAMMHESDSARNVQGGLTAVRHFLEALDRVEDRAAVQRGRYGLSSCSDPLYRYFFMTMEFFHRGNYQLGGQVLRLAFLSMDRRLEGPSLKTVSDLCFVLPHLLASRQQNDILQLYLGHLSSLVKAKLGEHPLSRVVQSLVLLVHRPDFILWYTHVLSKLNRDLILRSEDVRGSTMLWAWNQYFATVSRDDEDSRHRHCAEHRKIRREVRNHSVDPGLDKRLMDQEQAVCLVVDRCCDSDFESWLARAEEETRRVEPFEITLWPDHLFFSDPDYRAFLSHHLAQYFERRGDRDKAIEMFRRVGDHARNEMYVMSCMELERLLRQGGQQKEADEIKQAALGSEWLKLMQAKLEYV